MLWTIIVTLVGGLIIGLLGKWVAPGDRDNIPLWLTTGCGIVGMIVGSLIYWGLFGSHNRPVDRHEAPMSNAPNGVDCMRPLWQIAVAAAAVMAAAFVTGRSRS